MSPFACIYVPNFPVAAAVRAEPELKTLAVAILEGKPPLEKIIAVNEKATHIGIAPGMTKAQAELCEDLALRLRTPLQESSAHAALLDCAQSFSPCVEDAVCDTALLDLAGMESLLGSPPKIASALQTRASALGLDAKVAIASNPDAALLAARGLCYAGLCLAGSCGAGALAHASFAVIPRGQEAEQLGPLPIEVLFTAREETDEKKSAARLLETLNRWGIRTLRALAALPQVSLSERLGQEGLRLQQLACGAITRTLVPVEEPMLFEEAIELEHPIVLLEPLAFLLNRLLDQICARLGSRALSTQELRLTLDLETFASRNQQSKINQQFLRTLRLPLPMLDAKVFLKLLQLDLNAHPPGAPIMKIHLAAEPARPRPGQAGLFLPPSPEPEKLELTLARIASLVGEQKVGALELLDTHHPEGFRMQRFVAAAPEKNPREQPPEPTEEKSIITALRRFRPALRASVILENSQPVQLSCAKKKEVQGTVLWKAGPWRASGDWWKREAWSRDEWDIAVQNSSPRNGTEISFYRLVHDLLGGGWFVEGSYD
jgi:protein ImuB